MDARRRRDPHIMPLPAVSKDGRRPDSHGVCPRACDVFELGLFGMCGVLRSGHRLPLTSVKLCPKSLRPFDLHSVAEALGYA